MVALSGTFRKEHVVHPFAKYQVFDSSHLPQGASGEPTPTGTLTKSIARDLYTVAYGSTANSGDTLQRRIATLVADLKSPTGTLDIPGMENMAGIRALDVSLDGVRLLLEGDAAHGNKYVELSIRTDAEAKVISAAVSTGNVRALRPFWDTVSFASVR